MDYASDELLGRLHTNLKVSMLQIILAEQARTLRMPALSDSLLGLGSLKCRLPGSMPCSYAKQTLMRPVMYI